MEPNQQPEFAPQPKRSKLGSYLLVVVLILLFSAGSAYAAYAWQQKQVSNLKSQVTSLQSQVTSLQSRPKKKKTAKKAKPASPTPTVSPTP